MEIQVTTGNELNWLKCYHPLYAVGGGGGGGGGENLPKKSVCVDLIFFHAYYRPPFHVGKA